MSEQSINNQIPEERELNEAIEALKSIRNAANPDSPESYRCDDREGCLDFVHSKARAVLQKHQPT